MSVRSRIAVLALTAGFAVAACSGGPGSTASSTTAAPASEPPATASDLPTTAPSAAVEPTKLVVGLGFIPNVQFAPFYLADQEGYYEEAGLDVEFQNKIDPDLISLIGQGSVDIGLADGTSVIPAVSQGIPVTYIATIYGKFPSIVFSKASAGIDTPADLAGKRLGIPGRYGSSWIMLQALLASANLTPDDLEIVEYPDFGQGAAVIAGAVDVATGFVNNEPVQLELTGEEATVLHVDDVVPLPGNGLIVGASASTKAEAIRAFVAQTLRAMADIQADPQRGIDASVAAVPELASQPEVQAAVLDATIDTWTGPRQATGGLGAISIEDWQASIDYLTTLELVPNPVVAEDLVDLTYLPGA